MASSDKEGILYRIGKRILISKRRQTVRGSVIFLLTHLLLIMGMIFAAQIALVLIGVNDIYVPITGRIMGLVR